jgi:hypothetical protein
MRAASGNKNRTRGKVGRKSLFANKEWCSLREKRGGNATMQPQGFETDFWKDANLRKSWMKSSPARRARRLPMC